MNWIDTNSLISICACAIGLTQFFLWKHISKTKSYIEEKSRLLAQEEKIEILTTIAERAKNVVTKEDLEEITTISEEAKNKLTQKYAQNISYKSEKGKNLATTEDIEMITKQIEIVKNEISFENQRKNAYIEQRTERFVRILHLVEELHLQQGLLIYYLYDIQSIDKLSILIETSNKTLLDLIHESRLIYVSIKDSSINKTVEDLRDNAQKYALYICAIASNAINHLSNRKTYFDLAVERNMDTKLQEEAAKHLNEFMKLREEFERDISPKKEELHNSITSYLVVLDSLFNINFHLKFDLTDKKQDRYK